MSVTKKSSDTYQNNRLLLKSTVEQVPTFIGELGNLSELQENLLDKNGVLKSTNVDKSLRYDLGNTEDDKNLFELQTNFILDWDQPNTGHRFRMELSPSGPTMVYKNPHISDKEFRVTKTDLENWIKKKGNMGVYTLSQKSFDVVENNLNSLIKAKVPKPTITRTSNSYQRTNPKGETIDITSKEASYDFERVNTATENEIKSFVYDKDRMIAGAYGTAGIVAGEFNGQNTWQLIGGPKAQGGKLGLNFLNYDNCGSDEACKAKSRLQQDFIVDYFVNKNMQENWKEISSVNRKNLGDEGSKDISNGYINGTNTVRFNDSSLTNFGFKRVQEVDDKSDYTLAEIVSKYDMLKETKGKVNGFAQLLNAMSQESNPSNPVVYRSAQQIHAAYKGVEGFDPAMFPALDQNGNVVIYRGGSSLTAVKIDGKSALLNIIAKTYGLGKNVVEKITTNDQLIKTPQSGDDLVMNMSSEDIYDMLINGTKPTFG